MHDAGAAGHTSDVSSRPRAAHTSDVNSRPRAANVGAGSGTTDTRSCDGSRRARTGGMRTRRRPLGVRRLAGATYALGVCRERKDRERRSERKDDF